MAMSLASSDEEDPSDADESGDVDKLLLFLGSDSSAAADVRASMSVVTSIATTASPLSALLLLPSMVAAVVSSQYYAQRLLVLMWSRNRLWCII